ncbi:glycoside hydrolase family 97 catalytic domain-containing protein [Haloarchaeobius sp. HME9146]|uniref:glycoside hydrolase family 97 catalytic domain-containing protein n=1 Tax=Haloarchaeobius sp. HME9146 TaxID=2978732 RepID=UPI0034E95FF9
MFDEQSNHTLPSMDRREFVGGVASLVAASAFSLTVADETAAKVTTGNDAATQTVTSPDGTVAVTVDVADGVPSYSVSHGGETVVADSRLGFAFQDQPAFGEGIAVTGSERATEDTTWTPVWDQYDEIREQYEELRLGLVEETAPGRHLTLEVRAFDDGVGFRYVFPEESGFGEFVVTDERTEFAFTDDHTSWWVENDFNSYEYAYKETPLSEVGSGTPYEGAHTPITMETAGGRYLSVHEANLVDYAAMAVEPVAEGSTTVQSTLAPMPDGTKVSAAAPHRTPWRTIQIGERPGDLVESSLVLNLNDPMDPEEFPQGTDWIQPQKFLGVWWLMITGRADWEYTGPESGNHGAQTDRMKRYMDFASEHGIESVLVEGWNEGWDSYPGDGSTMDFDDTYPDFDIEAVCDHGEQLDPPVAMTAHNETAGNVSNYEAQLDNDPNPFADYDDLGINSIKTGYVADSGVSIDGTTYNHHCQALVNHHRLVYQEAAKNRQMLEVHEPVKPTGERRTYPNVMTREGVLGQEYDAFGYIDPSHHVTFPFTRMLGGPVEYTPGIFDMDSGSGGIETTRAKQLAMYPTYLSGLHMVADLPSSYLADQPAVCSVGEVCQAEFADSDGFTTKARWAGAQGGRYVPVDPNTVATDASLSWTVADVPETGEYAVHLRYASDAENNAVPADEPRTATIVANGDTTQVTFPPTAYWDEWATVSATVTLESGENDLALTLADGDTGGLNLDSVAVTEPGASMPEPDTDPTLGPTVDAFQFIEDVPAAGWDDTRVVDADIGSYMVTARQKDEEWFVGAMTDDNGRALDVPLDFLDSAPGTRNGHDEGTGKGHGGDTGNGNGNGQGKQNGQGTGHTKGKYVAEIYSDGIDARFDENLTDVLIDEAIVTADTTLLASTIESGGTAVRIRPADWEDVADLPEYEYPEQDLDVSIRDETFVQEPFVSATGSNSGDYIGGTTVELVVDGEVAASANVRFPPNSTDQTYEFSYAIDTPGTYDVVVQTTDGKTLASETVTVKPPETVATISDPTGDDHGPGEYTYPTAGAFPEGVFELTSVTVEQTPSIHQFRFEVETLNNAFGSSRGFSPHMFVCWLRDPSKSGGSTASLDDLGANVGFADAWHYRLEISGFTKSAIDATGAALTDADGNTVTVRESVDNAAGTVTLSLDREALDGVDAADLELVAMVQSENFGGLRPVNETAGGYTFGGAKPGAVDNAPWIMDLVTPDGVSQADALAYSDTERATLPFVSVGDE